MSDYISEAEFNAWPKCAVPACQNKCCLSLRSKYCWPHTPGDAAAARQNLLETEPVPSIRYGLQGVRTEAPA